ncbi:hypothetical protein EB105725_13_00920 [Shimwellia blattae DSM 4481 = NBRC 105725]|nr:hypothetical protein EB105725_13_00920 [Shimwellia blattae DSM 4481 = NBRC 105725]
MSFPFVMYKVAGSITVRANRVKCSCRKDDKPPGNRNNRRYNAAHDDMTVTHADIVTGINGLERYTGSSWID